MKKKIEIFKPGRHTDMRGKVVTVTAAELAAGAAAYDPAKFEAPLVVGHPTLAAPAYGWVGSVSYADGVMQAEADQVDAAFAELVNEGRYKKVSASFFLPEAPGNPVPGVYYLRHVGFLGAQAPAVKGLKSVAFAGEEEGVIEFGGVEERINAGLWRRLRDFLIGKFGLEEADQAIAGFDVSLLTEEAARPEPVREEITQALFAEGTGANQTKEDGTMPTPEELAAKEAALQQKEASFAEREARLASQEAAGRHQENVNFAEGLVKEGKLIAAMKDHAVALLDFAAGTDGGLVVEFGEGDGHLSGPAGEMLKKFLAGQPKVVEFGEFAPPDKDGGKTVEFAAAPGYAVDQTALELHNKAIAYQAANQGVPYLAAVKAVS